MSSNVTNTSGSTSASAQAHKARHAAKKPEQPADDAVSGTDVFADLLKRADSSEVTDAAAAPAGTEATAGKKTAPTKDRLDSGEGDVAHRWLHELRQRGAEQSPGGARGKAEQRSDDRRRAASAGRDAQDDTATSGAERDHRVATAASESDGASAHHGHDDDASAAFALPDWQAVQTQEVRAAVQDAPSGDGGVVGAAGLVEQPLAPSEGADGAAAANPMDAATAQAAVPEHPTSSGFGPALGAQLRTWLRDGVQHAKVVLNPEHLGPIDVRIALGDGAATQITLGADLQSTRDALQAAMPQLAEALQGVGLELAQGSVTDPSASSSGGAMNGDSGAGGREGGAAWTLAGAAAQALAGDAPVAHQPRGLVDTYA